MVSAGCIHVVESRTAWISDIDIGYIGHDLILAQAFGMRRGGRDRSLFVGRLGKRCSFENAFGKWRIYPRVFLGRGHVVRVQLSLRSAEKSGPGTSGLFYPHEGNGGAGRFSWRGP